MRLISLLPVVLLAACASAPQGPPTAAPSAPMPQSSQAHASEANSSQAHAPQVPAATPAAADAATGKPFEQIDARNIAEAQAAGYKVVNEKGNTLLCKKSLLTGTRLQYVTTCLTAMEWKETSDAARTAVKPNPVWKPERGN